MSVIECEEQTSVKEETQMEPLEDKGTKTNAVEPELDEKESVDDDHLNTTAPLYEQPAIVEGKRQRKSVQHFEITPPEQAKIEIASGKGTSLGEIPRVMHFLDKHTYEDLKVLHKVCFNSYGRKNEIKKNIKKFCGFDFAEDSPEVDKKKDVLNKSQVSHLKVICEVLDLERGGNKTELVDRIVSFLMLPKDSGKALPAKSKTPKKSKKKSKKLTKKGVNTDVDKKKKKVSEEECADSSPNDDDDDDDDEEEEEENVEAKVVEKKTQEKAKYDDLPDDDDEVEEKEDESEDEDWQKGQKKNKKKTPQKKKVTTGIKRKRPQKQATDDDEVDEDDEPISKLLKVNEKPPTDENIRKVVEKILKDVSLESITMRSVLNEVSSNFKDHDLTSKHDLIKKIVKEAKFFFKASNRPSNRVGSVRETLIVTLQKTFQSDYP